MKFSHLLFAFLVVSFSAQGIAQDKSAALLSESKAKFASLKDFSAKFSYGINSIEQRVKPITKTGDIKYQGGKYVVTLPDQVFFCDKKTQWIFLPNEKEVTILNFDPTESLSVESIFKIYEASSKSRYDGEEVVDGVACHKIYLTITDKTVDYNQAYLWVNKTTKLIAKAVLIDRNQTRTTLSFSEVKLNPGFTEDVFRFNKDKVPGITVFDER